MQKGEASNSHTETGIVYLSTNDFVGRLQKAVTHETFNCVGFYYTGIDDKTKVCVFDVLWTGTLRRFANATLDDLQRSPHVTKVCIRPVKSTLAFRMCVVKYADTKPATTKQLLQSIFHYTGGEVPSKKKINDALASCGETVSNDLVELSKMSPKASSESPMQREVVNELSSYPQLLESILDFCSHDAEWKELYSLVSSWSQEARNNSSVVLDLNALIRLVNRKSRQQIEELSEPVCATVSCSKNAKIQLRQGKEVLVSSCGNGLSQLRRRELEELLEHLDDEPQFDELRRKIAQRLAEKA
jgi:ribosomal protein S24E